MEDVGWNDVGWGMGSAGILPADVAEAAALRLGYAYGRVVHNNRNPGASFPLVCGDILSACRRGLIESGGSDQAVVFEDFSNMLFIEDASP